MSSDFIIFPFIKNGMILDDKDAPRCGLTVQSCGSMRFRWNEKNNLRQKKLSQISNKFDGKTFVPVEQNHTKIVFLLLQLQIAFQFTFLIQLHTCLGLFILDGKELELFKKLFSLQKITIKHIHRIFALL